MNLNLKNKINEDIISALKSNANDVALTLRFLMSVIKNNELLKRNKLFKEGKSGKELVKLSELTGDEIIKVILGEIKKRKESIVQYEKGGRGELAKKEMAELEILKKYAPEEMPEDELRSIVKKKIAEMGEVSVKDFGKIMSNIMAEIKGRAGGDVIKKIVEEELKR